MKTKDLHLKSWGLILIVGLFCFFALQFVSLFITKNDSVSTIPQTVTNTAKPIPSTVPVCSGCMSLRRVAVSGSLCNTSACQNTSEIVGASRQYGAVTNIETGDTTCYETQYLCDPENNSGECGCTDIRKGISEAAKKLTTREMCEGMDKNAANTCFKPADPKMGTGLKYVWENNMCVEHYYRCS